MIHISLSPNLEKDDVNLAGRLIFNRKSHLEGDARGVLELKIKSYFKSKYCFLTNSGRSALFVVLKAFNFEKGSEILIQVFTCNAVPNPILWNDLVPVYVDIDDSLNMDPNDLERKITPKSGAIIVQHTMGNSAEMKKITEIAKRHNLILIEDCAHSLGAKYDGKLVGTLGDVAFLSFGRDKVISSVYGGAIITNDQALAGKVKKIYDELPYPSRGWVRQQLLHPVITNFAIHSYNFFSLGKIILVLAQKMRLISLAVTGTEKSGKKPAYFPGKLPNALAALANYQMDKLERFNRHRKTIASLYRNGIRNEKMFVKENDGCIFLRFSILVKDPERLIAKAKEEGIMLGDWYRPEIAPPGSDFSALHYRKNCQKAKEASGKIVNLPTNVKTTAKDAEKIINLINDYEISD